MKVYEITIENHVKATKTDEIEAKNEYEALGKIFASYGQYGTYFRLVSIMKIGQYITKEKNDDKQ